MSALSSGQHPAKKQEAELSVSGTTRHKKNIKMCHVGLPTFCCGHAAVAQVCEDTSCPDYLATNSALINCPACQEAIEYIILRENLIDAIIWQYSAQWKTLRPGVLLVEAVYSFVQGSRDFLKPWDHDSFDLDVLWRIVTEQIIDQADLEGLILTDEPAEAVDALKAQKDLKDFLREGWLTTSGEMPGFGIENTLDYFVDVSFVQIGRLVLTRQQARDAIPLDDLAMEYSSAESEAADTLVALSRGEVIPDQQVFNDWAHPSAPDAMLFSTDDFNADDFITRNQGEQLSNMDLGTELDGLGYDFDVDVIDDWLKHYQAEPSPHLTDEER